VSGNPLVSAVIVNWNGAQHLRIALPSLNIQTYSAFEILVVDNGSGDDSAKVAAEFKATWIGLPSNIGLAPACNEGARRARGDYLVFLNNDMRFAHDFIENLVRTLQKDGSVFAADALQLDWMGTTRIHQATRLRRRSLIASYLQPGLLPLLDIVQEPVVDPVTVLQACAAAMMVRRRMFEALGGFDERLTVSWEDTEICWRAWLRGWSSVFVPSAVCWHRVGASVLDNPKGEAARFKGTIGGRLLFATKLLPPVFAFNAWMVSWLSVARDLATARIGAALRKASVIVQYTLLAPRLFVERRRLYAEAGTTTSVQLKQMLRIGLSEDLRCRSEGSGIAHLLNENDG
jgi:GT2 family glycosyltransferase